MKFLRTALFNEPRECAELRTLYVPDAPPFAAFTVHGEDKNPQQLDLYRNARPAHDENPVVVYILAESGVMERRA